jgi:hypothetical protein
MFKIVFGHVTFSPTYDNCCASIWIVHVDVYWALFIYLFPLIDLALSILTSISFLPFYSIVIHKNVFMIELQSWTYINKKIKYRENETQSKLHGVGSHEEFNLTYFQMGSFWKLKDLLW